MSRNYGYDQELEGKSYPPGLKNDSLETDAGRIGFPSDALGLAPCPLRGPWEQHKIISRKPELVIIKEALKGRYSGFPEIIFLEH